MTFLHHYSNTSVNPWFDGTTMPVYDGDDYHIAPYESVILVPCNSDDPEHRIPSMSSCRLLMIDTTGVEPADENDVQQLLITYMIYNSTDVGLLLRHGDLLGAYYSGPHERIRAVGSYMHIRTYNAFIVNLDLYLSEIDSAVQEYHDKNNINNDDDETEEKIETDNPMIVVDDDDDDDDDDDNDDDDNDDYDDMLSALTNIHVN